MMNIRTLLVRRVVCVSNLIKSGRAHACALVREGWAQRQGRQGVQVLGEEEAEEVD